MGVSRRKLLVAGGATALVTLAGGYGILSYPSLTRASQPWKQAGLGFDDPRLNALSYAILAPNPHNRQPWQFALVGEDAIDVTCDLDRRLPATDPFDRQITIGFGCMLETLSLAAARAGFRAEIDPFPDGEGQPRLDQGRVAQVRLVPGGEKADPLAASILERRSTKEPFAERDVAEADLRALSAILSEGVRFGFTGDDAERAAIADNAWRGWVIEQETDATRRESIDVMRIGNDAVVEQPDGIDLGGTFMSAAHAAGIVTHETLDTPGSLASQSGYDMYSAMVEATPRWAWLATEGNSRFEQLEAGRSWVRVNLAAQARGLAVHPWSQTLQEFPEMAALYTELHKLVAPGGGTVQMLARVGYGPPVPASPRWPLEAKLIDA